MNIMGTNVIHRLLGKGKVTQQEDNYIMVEFGTKISKFQYPEAFRNFLTAEETKIQKEILSEISVLDAKIIEDKLRAEEFRREEEAKNITEFAQKVAYKNTDKLIKRVNREIGQNLTFLVFQGNTFDAECKGGFIWAPKYNQAGGKCHHWDKLMDVREGDLIIHCAEGYIRAISIAKGSCYDAESPRELTEEQLWAKDGRMVDCEYIKVNEPIKHSEYKETILQYCNVKYAPFDKDGNGNMGYLFDIDRDLAKFFIEKTIIKNSFFLDVEPIQDILK